RKLGKLECTQPAELVIPLCEAAWVMRKQADLSVWLNKDTGLLKEFTHSHAYGSTSEPAWQIGYNLALQARNLLDCSDSDPISSLTKLVEQKLGIAVIQLTLPTRIAGATIDTGRKRGIVLNAIGENTNVWVRRMTLAHELGHVLWDPKKELKSLTVDGYAEIASDPSKQTTTYYVEQRANAFAVAFLAPPSVVITLDEQGMKPSEILSHLMEVFGLSFTAARLHIRNIISADIPTESPQKNVNLPGSEWLKQESLTRCDFLGDTVPLSRRGNFAILVEEAERRGLISDDTAASHLGCSLDKYIDTAREPIRNLGR
ncbi:MAG: ImmA/IrrE family metallo-endopeptidase, partial [Fimbriimonadaceae bacterium]